MLSILGNIRGILLPVCFALLVEILVSAGSNNRGQSSQGPRSTYIILKVKKNISR